MIANKMGRAKPDVRPPGAAISSAKSIQVVQILPAAMAVRLLRSGDWRQRVTLVTAPRCQPITAAL